MADRKVTSEPRVEELLATIRRAIDQDINELDRRAQDSRARAAEPPTPLRGTLNDFQNKYAAEVLPDADQDIARLRQRVKNSRLEDPTSLPPVPPPMNNPQRGGHTVERGAAFSTILSQPQRSEPPPLRRPAPPPQQNYQPPVAEELPPQAYEPYDSYEADVWHEPAQPPEMPQQAYYPPAVYPPGAQPHYPQQQPGLMSPESTYATQTSFDALAQLVMTQIGGEAGLHQITRQMLQPMLKEWLDHNLPPLVEALVREEIERVARGRR